MTQWKNRIVESGEIDASELLGKVNRIRIHPQRQREMLEKLLPDIGWVDRVMISVRSGLVLDGRERVELAAAAGQKVPYDKVDLTEAEEKKILATFDYITTLAEWDTDEMSALIASMDGEVDDIIRGIAEDLDLFPPEEHPGDPGAQLDRAEELREIWGVERGQIWQVGRHRVMCGDSTSEEDVGRLARGATAYLMATDPPYGVDFEGQKYNPRAKAWDGIEGDLLQGEALRVWLAHLIEVWLPYLSRQAGFYFWAAAMEEGAAAAAAIRDVGLHIQSQIIWRKNTLVLGQADYQWMHENCWYAFFKGEKHRWFGGRDKVTVWDVDKVANASYQHPMQKPLDLYAIPIRNHTQHGEVCLDPFVGSGTQVVAAEQTGRICYGMEIEPKYVAVTLQRLADMGLKPELT